MSPTKPPTPCSRGSCPEVTTSRFCEEHRRQHQREKSRKRRQEGRKDDFYSSRRWRKARRQILANEPLCRDCRAEGVTKAAEAVHHLTPKDEAPELALASTNLAPLCRHHHRIRHSDDGG